MGKNDMRRSKKTDCVQGQHHRVHTGEQQNQTGRSLLPAVHE